MKSGKKNIVWQITLKYAVLFFVIVGLLFSSAEGVRLLPFSDDPVRAGQSSDTFLEIGPNKYNPAIQRFGTGQNRYSQNKTEPCPVIIPSFESTKLSQTISSNNDCCYASLRICSKIDASSTVQGRAPPRL